MQERGVLSVPVNLEQRPAGGAQVEADSQTPGRLPAIIEAAGPEANLLDWLEREGGRVPGMLACGAVLFRGFSLRHIPEFERAARVLCPSLHADYGDLPKEADATAIYRSTPYPASRMILYHNESSHQNTWPMKQFFFCMQAAQHGGETPLVDCREVYRALDHSVRARFESKGLRYIRSFVPGLDVSWQQFFGTSDRAEVERSCAQQGMVCDWRSDGGFRTIQVRPAVVRHPRTGEHLFFNQIQLHHPACLESDVRRSMEALFAPGDEPRNVQYGDGTPIDDEVIGHVRSVYAQLAVEFRWREGDLLLVDNMLVAHARNPFTGPRKIVVAMGEMVGDPSSAFAAHKDS